MIKITVIIVLFVKTLLIVIIQHGLKKLRQIVNLLNLKLAIESGLLSIRIFLAKEIFVIDSVLKTSTWMYKIKDLNGERSNRKLLWKRMVV